MSSKGRIELQISLSRAKNYEDVAGDVRFCLAPQKPCKNCEKTDVRTKFSEIFGKRPDASKRIQMRPNASERIRTGPSRSEQVRKLKKSCEDVENLANIREKIAKNREKNRESLVFS